MTYLPARLTLTFLNFQVYSCSQENLFTVYQRTAGSLKTALTLSYYRHTSKQELTKYSDIHSDYHHTSKQNLQNIVIYIQIINIFLNKELTKYSKIYIHKKQKHTRSTLRYDGRKITLSLRLAWATYLVPVQASKNRREVKRMC